MMNICRKFHYRGLDSHDLSKKRRACLLMRSLGQFALMWPAIIIGIMGLIECMAIPSSLHADTYMMSGEIQNSNSWLQVGTWRSPKSVSWYSHPGTPGHEPAKSIDGDTNTFWFLQGSSQGEITYYLDANYQISQIRIFDGETAAGKSQIQAWVTDDGNYDPASPSVTWEVINNPSGGCWFESMEFDKKGRYLSIKVVKKSPGPLGKVFCEVQFKGAEEPTLVELDQFGALCEYDQIILTWNTLSEIDNAGFNLWRSEEEKGEYIKINQNPIEAAGGATLGADYSYTDDTAIAGVRYYYMLEDIDTKGLSTFRGPIPVTLSLTRAFEESQSFSKHSLHEWYEWYQKIWSPYYYTSYPFYYMTCPFWGCTQLGNLPSESCSDSAR